MITPLIANLFEQIIIIQIAEKEIIHIIEYAPNLEIIHIIEYAPNLEIELEKIKEQQVVKFNALTEIEKLCDEAKATKLQKAINSSCLTSEKD